MNAQEFTTHTFENGLTLVLEPMTDVQSAAFSLLVPSGSIYDPVGQNGSAAILCDWVTRGAGDRDSKRLSADLDNLGIQRSESVSCSHLLFSGATLADNLAEGLRVYGDILQRPRLPADQFDAARTGVEQMLRAMVDEPRQKLIVELRRRCYASPWGWPCEGTLDELEAIDADTVRHHFAQGFRPNGAILGVAGRIDVAQVTAVVEDVFGGWTPQPEPSFETGTCGSRLGHLPHDSAQTHIGIAYDAVPYRDPDYYAAWAAVGVLSGGMSARLFTEVRERRGLCYAVSASLHCQPDEGRILCYAGTTPDRAQQTLDVTLGELVRLGEGIAPEELERCKARAKSSLVMQQESTIARASSIARDWFLLGRVTTLAEVRDRIEALTVERVGEYVHQHPARDFTVLTIGPEPLEVNVEVP